jgi:hypothetical protein
VSYILSGLRDETSSNERLEIGEKRRGEELERKSKMKRVTYDDTKEVKFGTKDEFIAGGTEQDKNKTLAGSGDDTERTR